MDHYNKTEGTFPTSTEKLQTIQGSAEQLHKPQSCASSPSAMVLRRLHICPRAKSLLLQQMVLRDKATLKWERIAAQY